MKMVVVEDALVEPLKETLSLYEIPMTEQPQAILVNMNIKGYCRTILDIDSLQSFLLNIC